MNNQPTKLNLHTVIYHNAISAQQASVVTSFLRAIATQARYFGKYAQVMLLQPNKNSTTLHTHTHDVNYDEFDSAVIHGAELMRRNMLLTGKKDTTSYNIIKDRYMYRMNNDSVASTCICQYDETRGVLG